MSEVARHVPGVDAKVPAAERAFLLELKVDTPVIANSALVKTALSEHFGIAAERISVIYPGFRSDRFDREQARAVRAAARRALRLAAETPLLGFVTSGDLAKRGLDLFLAVATEVVRARPDARFLVVGSRRLPAWALAHPLVAAGTLQHRPKSVRPLQWFAALDVFVYPAHFEEFGMVILEALACGIPVVTSRRVGAAECLPAQYEPWLSGAPEPERFAELTVRLLDDEHSRQALAAAGEAAAARFDQASYARAAVAAILRFKNAGSSKH
jgi:glycosyltransferase involved in cell wall biosynthesis